MTTTTVRCAPWTNEGVGTHRVMIEGNVVRVLDPVSGTYTACHRLSARTQRRIAAEVAAR